MLIRIVFAVTFFCSLSSFVRADCFKDAEACDAPARQRVEQDRARAEAEERRAAAAEKLLSKKVLAANRLLWKHQIEAMPFDTDHAGVVTAPYQTEGLWLRRTGETWSWIRYQFPKCTEMFVYSPGAPNPYANQRILNMMAEMVPHLSEVPSGYTILYNNPIGPFSAIKTENLIPFHTLAKSNACSQ